LAKRFGEASTASRSISRTFLSSIFSASFKVET